MLGEKDFRICDLLISFRVKYFKRKNFLFQYGIGIAFDFQDFKYLSFALFRPFI